MSHKTPSRRVSKTRSLAAQTLILLAISVTAHSISTPPENTIQLDVMVAGHSLKGVDYADAGWQLERRYQSLLREPIEVEVNGETYTFSAAELGFSFDSYKTLEQVYEMEQAETTWDSMQVSLLNQFNTTEIAPFIHSNSERLWNTLSGAIPGFGESSLTFEVFGLTSTLDLETSDTTEVVEEEVESLAGEAEIDPSSVHWSQISIPEPFTFTYNDGETTQEFKVRFGKDWLDFSNPNEEGKYTNVDEARVRSYIEETLAPQIDIASSDAILWTMPTDGSDYATVEGIAADGRRLNVDTAVTLVMEGLANGTKSADLPVEEVAGRILNESGVDLGEMTLLGTGYSNFETSPSGRSFNVRKGLNEKINSIVVAPGADYDFNKNLGPVTYSAGWQGSLAIFGGTDLVTVPGGGLCQTSTTVYRAALNAGFPITEQRNHSLYVHYYTDGGDGLDATIYPGSQNLKFTNDSPNYILIQAYDDGYDAWVKIYGTDTGRSAELIGPFYPGEIPAEYQGQISLNYNQIGWIRVVRDGAGNETLRENRISTYRSIPY